MFPELTRDDIFRIETSRLWLRWPQPADANAFRRIFGRGDMARQIGAISQCRAGADASVFILAARAGNAEGRVMELSMALKSTGAVIGEVSARPESGEISLDFFVDATWRGLGYVGEAFDALIDVLFALTAAPRLRARAPHGDARIALALEKRGFKLAREGRMRCNDPAARPYLLDRARREGARAVACMSAHP